MPVAGSELQPLIEHTIGSVSGLLAIIGGVFTLRGRNWARWLCAVWMGGHVILSLFHSRWELLVHSLLFAAVLYVFFRPAASAYFRDARAGSN